MIELKELKTIFEKADIRVFGFDSSEAKEDIILKGNDINEFVELCTLMEADTVYYNYVQMDKKMFTLDKSYLKEECRILFDDAFSEAIDIMGIPPQYSDSPEADELWQCFEETLDEVIADQRRIMKKIDWKKPAALRVMFPAEGFRICFEMMGEDIEPAYSLMTEEMVIDNMSAAFESMILGSEKLTLENEMKSLKKEGRDLFLLNIKSDLTGREEVMTCRDELSKYAFARTYVIEAEEHGIEITVKDVIRLIDEEYLRRSRLPF